MLQGIAYALGACLVWGMIFVIPQFLDGFTSIEITFGCYLFYGFISLLFFFIDKKQYTLSIWIKALYFSFISAIVYYTCVVLALRYAPPSICALTLGTTPIAIAFYGNWKKKECRFRSLLFPAFLIILGLVIINVPKIQEGNFPSQYFLGLALCSVGLMAWCWYVVENSRFLKDNSHIASTDWATLIGVATLFWVLLGSLVILLFFHHCFDFTKYFDSSYNLFSYFVGTAILGLGCTWLAGFLWNRASLKLPISLLGQLAVFETIFGLVYVYTVDQRLPTYNEGIGISLFLSAVAYGIRNSNKNFTAVDFEPRPSE